MIFYNLLHYRQAKSAAADFPVCDKRLKNGVLKLQRNAGAVRSPYNVAKAGLIGFAKTLAIELGDHNIRANAIAPGAVGLPI